MRSVINLVLIITCALTAFAREEFKRDFQKTVALAPGKTFRIDHRLGNIEIRTQAGSQASIHAVIRTSAGTAAEARRVAESIQISVDEAATGVSVRTTYPSNWNNVSFGVDYDITLPDTAPLNIRNRFGGVTVVDAHAGASINNGNGRVSVSGGRGRLEVENAFGSVEIRGNDGDLLVRGGNGAVTANDVTGTADITNRFGSVEVRNLGKGLTIHSNNGGIDAINVGGGANIANSFGKVVVTDAKGDLFVQNQNGEIQATGIAGGADLHNSFAGVRFTRIGKNLTVRSQNANVVGDTVGGSATVETTFGGVDLRDVKGGARVTAGNSSVRLTGVAGEVFAKTSFGGVTITDAAGPVTVESRQRIDHARSPPRPEVPAGFAAHHFRADPRHRSPGSGIQPERADLLRAHPVGLRSSGERRDRPRLADRQDRRRRLRPAPDGSERKYRDSQRPVTRSLTVRERARASVPPAS